MLVIANGAPKSGSTWLFNIIQDLHAFSDVPKEFLLDRDNPNSEIVYERLPEFLETVDFTRADYLIKNHFGTAAQRDAILGSRDTLVVNIKRDLKDAVVSSYFHDMRTSKTERSFESYYWRKGRYMAANLKRYHRVWETSPSSRILFMSYERLKAEPVTEVMGLCRFLGFETAREVAEKAVEGTSMDRLREKYNDSGAQKFFRKGVAGDWKNYFHGPTLEDIREIEANGLNRTFGRRAMVKLRTVLHRN